MPEQQGRERGFTRIELLVVVACLGLIATIAVFSLTSAPDQRRQERSMVDLHSIAETAEAYNIGHGVNHNGIYGEATPEVSVDSFFIESPTRDSRLNGNWVVTGTEGVPCSRLNSNPDRIQGTWAVGPPATFDIDVVYADVQFFQGQDGEKW